MTGKTIRKEILSNMQYINEENLKVFDEITMYIASRMNLNELEVAEFELDLISLIVEGQNEGRDIKEIIGHDIKTFSNDIIESIEKKKKIDSIKYYGSFVFNMIPINYLFTYLIILLIDKVH